MPEREDCLVEEHLNPNVRGLGHSATISIYFLSYKLSLHGL